MSISDEAYDRAMESNRWRDRALKAEAELAALKAPSPEAGEHERRLRWWAARYPNDPEAKTAEWALREIDRLRATQGDAATPTVASMLADLFIEMPGAGYVVLSCLEPGSRYGVSVAHEGGHRKVEGPTLRSALEAALKETTP